MSGCLVRGKAPVFVWGLCAATVSCGGPNPDPPSDIDLALVLATDTVFAFGNDSPLEDGRFLSRVIALDFDRQGNLHVLDPDQYRVFTWNDRGRLVRRFGQRGEGPHEFQVPRHLYALPDGRVVVVDIGHSALQVFGGGRFDRSVRMPTAGGAPVPGSRSVLAGGRLVGPDDYWLTRPEHPGRVPLFSFAFHGDSLAHRPYHDAWRTLLKDRAMLPKVHVAGFSDGRVAVVDSIGYEITVLSHDGQVADVIERPIEARPVTESAMEAERNRRAGSISATDITRGLAEMASAVGVSIRSFDPDRIVEEHIAGLDDLAFADDIPVIRDIAVDGEDRLWVTRSDALGDDGLIDLFDASGTYLGTLYGARKPDAFGPRGLLAFINDHDELDTQSVLVVRITSIAPAMASRSALANQEES